MDLLPLKNASVILDSFEWELVRFCARARETAARRQTAEVNTRGVDHLVNHIVGAAGEWAFCQLANVFAPMRCVAPNRRTVGDVFGDCVLRGRIIDVKTTGIPDQLLVPLPNDKLDWIFVLMERREDELIYRGAMEGRDLLRADRVVEVGALNAYTGQRYRAKSYKADACELRELDDLLDDVVDAEFFDDKEGVSRGEKSRVEKV